MTDRGERHINKPVGEGGWSSTRNFFLTEDIVLTFNLIKEKNIFLLVRSNNLHGIFSNAVLNKYKMNILIVKFLIVVL